MTRHDHTTPPKPPVPPVPTEDLGPRAPSDVLAVALDLAARGWPVFPCVPGAKRPLTRHGLHDATTDPDRIRTWWARTPSANLAVPTGPGTVDVLDIDRRPTGSGYPAFRVLAEAGLIGGATAVIATPSGGIHVYFPGTDQPSGRAPEHFVDFKAAGGYVLVPPSVVNGAPYHRLRRRPGPGRPLDWATARTLLTPPTATIRHAPGHRAARGASVASLADWVASLPEGRRNNGAFWAACRAAEEGHRDLRPIVAAAVRAGLSELEAHRTVTSAQRMIARTAQHTPATGTTRGRR